MQNGAMHNNCALRLRHAGFFDRTGEPAAREQILKQLIQLRFLASMKLARFVLVRRRA
jgi:hypothetical protein